MSNFSTICSATLLNKSLYSPPLSSFTFTSNFNLSLQAQAYPGLLHSKFYNSTKRRCRSLRVRMSSDSLHQTSIVLGCGAVSVDFLATVASYPKPDDKIRSTGLKVQGGGNAGNALTCVARLGLKPRVISKVADDTQGRGILDELKADGVDTSFIVVSKEGTSPFTYIIVDNQTKTRTCIHTPGYPPMIPEDLPESRLLAALDGARIVYFDGRLHETALVIAHEYRQYGRIYPF